MISQEKFIKDVTGKKEVIQWRFVRILRTINSFLPLKIKNNLGKTADFTYLTICRQSDFDMVAASLYTLFKTSDFLPNNIAIVSDGSWLPEVGENYFRKHGVDITCVEWQKCADFYSKTCPSLKKWAEGHIWGKKMAAILYFSETQKVLFSDPDILWYKTPLTSLELDNCKFKVSIDNSHNYDDEFIKTCGFECLYDRDEPINCGAVYIHGGLKLLSQDALMCIEYEGEHCGKFAEQTVFAIMDLEYNTRWSMKEITSEISDLLYPFWARTIKYNGMIARHYLWRFKWIYWKDYFKIRMTKIS